MVLCAALLVAAAALSALTVDNNVLRPAGHHQVPEPECRTCCLVGAAAGARQQHRAGPGGQPASGTG
jgi:hypothetical protein